VFYDVLLSAIKVNTVGPN